jgi:hypothetical protein
MYQIGRLGSEAGRKTPKARGHLHEALDLCGSRSCRAGPARPGPSPRVGKTVLDDFEKAVKATGTN